MPKNTKVQRNSNMELLRILATISVLLISAYPPYYGLCAKNGESQNSPLLDAISEIGYNEICVSLQEMRLTECIYPIDYVTGMVA